MVFVEQVNGSDNLVGLSQLRALLSVESPLEILDLSQLMESCIVLVGFQAQQGNVSLDLASFCMDLAVIIFVDFFDNSQRLKRILCKICFILEFTKVHHDLRKIISICILFQITESIHSLGLVLNGLFNLLGLIKNTSHFEISITQLLLLELWIL